MQNCIFKKIISLLIVLSLCLGTMLSLVGCNVDDGSGGDFDTDNEAGNDDTQGENAPDEDDISEDYHDKIYVPEYKEYDRNTVKFSDITYKRPNFDQVNSNIASVIEIIEKNEAPFEDQIASIVDLEDDYTDVLTMYVFAKIYNSKDSSVAYWNEEYSYVTANYPSFAEKIEDMFVAAANSPHAERFETEYFGDGLIEEYKDGGNFTDNMIELWADEEQLESEYSSLSTATIEVTYLGKTDTVDNITRYYLDKYGENSTEYLTAYSFCMTAYSNALEERSAEILVNLFKVRKLIAQELGHSSYINYAYETHGRDYSPEKMNDFLADITKYVLPVYSVLSYYIFSGYFQTNLPSDLRLEDLINTAYTALCETDEELADIYRYMLQFDLYDVELSETNRQQGAFTTYLDEYDAPFLFISAAGSVSDYMTLFHEFGHFSEKFINYSTSVSLDQQEVSSQGLEFLMLHYIEDHISDKDIKYLKYEQLSNALQVLIIQGFYAKFEEIAYNIPYDSINKQELDNAVIEAAESFNLNPEYFNSISAVMIPHIFMYPFYVQSYCTSIVPALQLYFMENDESGSGLLAYKRLLELADGELTFIEAMESAGLDSPFKADILRDIADDIYYEIIGKHYYSQGDKDQNAA